MVIPTPRLERNLSLNLAKEYLNYYVFQETWFKCTEGRLIFVF